ncbi:hypothetical protein [Streptomyces sp. GS7]|uniref:hypothetical protein n=1 Tax=Streptomyces sp. GS7 TaxID=2692234 RepID=UPI003FA6C98A
MDGAVDRVRAVAGVWRRRAGRWYGEGVLQLLLLLASFALTGYAGLRLLSDARWPLVVVWFAGAALLHDLVLVPLYSVADRAVARLTAGGARDRAWTGFVRVPAALSGLLLLVWWPLISTAPGSPAAVHYTQTTGLPAEVFLARWLLISAGLFALAALWLLVRTLRTAQPRLRETAARLRRRATKQRSTPGS